VENEVFSIEQFGKQCPWRKKRELSRGAELSLW
jgi:hypothetical protein